MKTITLEINNVPEVESVIQEIKQNAETTIRNYWDREIRVVPEAKEIEFKAKLEAFRTDNRMTAEVVETVEKDMVTEVVKDDIMSELQANNNFNEAVTKDITK